MQARTKALWALSALATLWMWTSGSAQVAGQPQLGGQARISIAAPVFGGPRIPISSLPFTVEECGSYFLTGCLTGSPGAHGITIDADDVTIDLNGFSLIGVPGSLNAIQMVNPRKNFELLDGLISDWDGTGISIAGPNAFVGGVGIRSVDGDAIRVLPGGKDYLFLEPAVVFTLGAIQLEARGTIRNPTITGGSGDGIEFKAGSSGSLIFGGALYDNLGNGISIASGVQDIRIAGTTIRGSGLAGVRASLGGFVFENLFCSGNTGDGIHLDSSSSDGRVTGCHLTANGGAGLRVEGARNVVVKNSASDNTQNYVVSAGNDVGPIGSAVSATSPWANIQN